MDASTAERHATYAHLSRLRSSTDFLSVMNLLLWAPRLDLAIHIALFLLLLWQSTNSSFSVTQLIVIFALPVSHLTLWRINLNPIRPGSRSQTIAEMLSWFIVIYVRPVIAVGCGGRLLRHGINPATVVTLLFLIWAPLAIAACRRGRYTGVFWWPIIWTWPLIELIRNMSLKLLKLISFYLLSMGIIAAISWAIMSGFKLLWNGFVKTEFPFLYDRVMFFFAHLNPVHLLSIGAVLVALSVLPWMYRWCNNWIRWHRWLKNRVSNLTVQSFLTVVNEYHDESFYLRTIRFVREQGLLRPATETEDLLARLIITIERSGMRQSHENPPRTGGASQTGNQRTETWSPERWLTEFTWHHSRLDARSKAVFLDELCMLYEKIRAKGQSLTGGQNTNDSSDTPSIIL